MAANLRSQYFMSDSDSLQRGKRETLEPFTGHTTPSTSALAVLLEMRQVQCGMEGPGTPLIDTITCPQWNKRRLGYQWQEIAHYAHSQQTTLHSQNMVTNVPSSLSPLTWVVNLLR